MKITRLEAWPVEMVLDEPYEIAHQRYDRAHNVLVRLVTDKGPVSFGCSAPEPAVTGETAEGVLATLTGTIGPAVQGSDPLRRLRVLESALRAAPEQPAALAAIDLALWDFLGKVTGQPVYRLLGGYRDRIHTSVTIGILPEDETTERARSWVEQGFRSLKIKGGRDPAEDASRLASVRRAIGPRIELRFDGNQGYTARETLEFVELTRSLGLRVIEQPTPESHEQGIGRLRAEAEAALMADESLKTLADAFHIARGRLYDMINVKLMKVGGIEEAVRISAVARSAGMRIMVGCMDECALGIAGGLHFALGRGNVRYADLDGHFGLQGDPTAGCVRLERGTLRPVEAPGLGIVDL